VSAECHWTREEGSPGRSAAELISEALLWPGRIKFSIVVACGFSESKCSLVPPKRLAFLKAFPSEIDSIVLFFAERDQMNT
jgi:hypothetical protein